MGVFLVTIDKKAVDRLGKTILRPLDGSHFLLGRSHNPISHREQCPIPLPRVPSFCEFLLQRCLEKISGKDHNKIIFHNAYGAKNGKEIVFTFLIFSSDRKAFLFVQIKFNVT